MAVVACLLKTLLKGGVLLNSISAMFQLVYSTKTPALLMKRCAMRLMVVLPVIAFDGTVYTADMNEGFFSKVFRKQPMAERRTSHLRWLVL